MNIMRTSVVICREFYIIVKGYGAYVPQVSYNVRRDVLCMVEKFKLVEMNRERIGLMMAFFIALVELTIFIAVTYQGFYNILNVTTIQGTIEAAVAMVFINELDDVAATIFHEKEIGVATPRFYCPSLQTELFYRYDSVFKILIGMLRFVPPLLYHRTLGLLILMGIVILIIAVLRDQCPDCSADGNCILV